jgi:hypothetical protein
MSDISKKATKEATAVGTWRNGYTFALLILFIFGLTLIVLGAKAYQQGTVVYVILISTGVVMAPTTIVASLFRLFLFQEVKYQLTRPVIDEIKEKISPEILEQIKEVVDNYKLELNNIANKYRSEIETLEALKDAGILHPYRDREMALKAFASAIDTESSEITVIGSSLKGLLQKGEYKDIADKLKFKIQSTDVHVHVRFLLTHPIVADLRANQEARKPGEIGAEIINSLHLLKEWGVKPEDVRLYKGTPTCFAIKTKRKMLLNPYPYSSVSFNSPCLIVETSDEHRSYFYEAFDKCHFVAWDSDGTEHISDYDIAINKLQTNLKIYSDAVEKMLQV